MRCPRGGFAQSGKDGKRIGMIGERPRQLLRLDGLSVGDRDADSFDTERLAQAAPTFSESAGDQADGLATGRQTIDNGRLQRSGSRTCKRDDLVPGAKNILQILQYFSQNLPKFGRPVVVDRPGQIQQRFFGHRGGAGSQQTEFHGVFSLQVPENGLY